MSRRAQAGQRSRTADMAATVGGARYRIGMTRGVLPPTPYPSVTRAAAPRYWTREDRLGLGPVLLEPVVLALRRREDVDDHRPEVDQDPVRRRRPFAPDRLGLLVAQAADDPVRDRLELPLRPARADDEVVGHRGQAGEIEQDDVGRLLVLGQLDDPPGELERRALGGRRGLGALGQAVGARRGRGLGGRSGHGGFGHDGGSLRVCWYRAMVADVGRDRIRDEVAQRATGRRARAQLARREAQARPVEEGRAVGEVRQVLGAGSRGRRPGSRRVARRRPVPAPGPAAARARSSARGRPRPTGSASRSGESPAASRAARRSSSVSTVYDGPVTLELPAIHGEPVVAGDRELDHRQPMLGGRDRPSPACAAAGRPA